MVVTTSQALREYNVSTSNERIITAHCPICRTLIPIVTVTFTTTGLWRKHVAMELDGDATDYVTHLWAHQQGIIDIP